MASEQMRMPSGQGGLVRYFDEYKSKIEVSPGMVIIMCIVVMAIVILLNYFGKGFLGQ